MSMNEYSKTKVSNCAKCKCPAIYIDGPIGGVSCTTRDCNMLEQNHLKKEDCIYNWNSYQDNYFDGEGEKLSPSIYETIPATALDITACKNGYKVTVHLNDHTDHYVFGSPQLLGEFIINQLRIPVN